MVLSAVHSNKLLLLGLILKSIKAPNYIAGASQLAPNVKTNMLIKQTLLPRFRPIFVVGVLLVLRNLRQCSYTVHTCLQHWYKLMHWCKCLPRHLRFVWVYRQTRQGLVSRIFACYLKLGLNRRHSPTDYLCWCYVGVVYLPLLH